MVTVKYQVGDIVEGIVTGVQPYGAFVSIDQDTQGLIHISEVTNGFVKDIHAYIQEGETIKVKIIEMDNKENKLALSIRAIEDQLKKESVIADKEGEHGFHTLKDKLQEWIKQSE
ncbi:MULTISPECIES: S1 domain-containing post-transcriptional regulator GSP13 [Gracilibacillus]|uniref:S1 domain-containing post-transcriptional regulator GSP13 n=1 Tax=Gracilibacillus TaxID=74385 RepID=UPI000825E44A|nr:MULTISPECIES: S1 domain-containing post-transcriptional regulator GSP13 [Gracilibacillus]